MPVTMLNSPHLREKSNNPVLAGGGGGCQETHGLPRDPPTIVNATPLPPHQNDRLTASIFNNRPIDSPATEGRQIQLSNSHLYGGPHGRAFSTDDADSRDPSTAEHRGTGLSRAQFSGRRNPAAADRRRLG